MVVGGRSVGPGPTVWETPRATEVLITRPRDLGPGSETGEEVDDLFGGNAKGFARLDEGTVYDS